MKDVLLNYPHPEILCFFLIIFFPTLNTRSWKLQCSVTPVWDTLWDGTFSDSFENLMMNK